MPISPAIHYSTPMLTAPVPIFLVVLLIILVAPIILNRLKIPHIIGLIVAGVVVGPYGINLLARDMSFEVFGQVGILYLMFLAGIEIDMYHLKKNLPKGMVFGLFTFLIPIVVGSFATHYILRLDLLTAILMSSMFAAHTLIAYPIVSRLGLTKSPAVIIAIAGTIFTVLGSLIVLAGVIGVYKKGEFQFVDILRLVLSLGIYCAVLVYAYPRITRWFFKHWNDNILQFIFVLAMMFLAAQLSALIGIEAVFGAFFSGIVLNRYIPAKSPLMVRIEFVGNAIFIPYFLIGVGMMIDIGVVTKGWETIYVAAVMSAVAMLCKWLAAFATQKTFRMSSTDRSVMYQLSNAHTAVALAVVTIGYGFGLFNEMILNATVIMILVTCTVSSIGTSRAAQRLKVQIISLDDSHEKRTQRKRSSNVLIPVSNPLTAKELVDLAILMRGKDDESDRAYALYVRNDNSPTTRSIGRNSLDTAEQVASGADVRITPIERYDLNFVTGITNTIEERDIDRIIIGLHRRTAVIDSFFGEKLTSLLRATNKMLVISRCFIPVNTIRRIVVMVPLKAQFETGFGDWVRSLGNLATQLGCRLIFCCSPDTEKAIAGVLRMGRYGIRSEYRTIEQWDDFILLANRILDDDLFVVVNARRGSVSHTADLDTLPGFLQKYFSTNNIIVLYPEQFGEQVEEIAITDTMAADIVSVASPLWEKLSDFVKRLLNRKRRNSQPLSDDKISL